MTCVTGSVRFLRGASLAPPDEWVREDRTRIEAFGEATAEVVSLGDVVIDLGAGSGILGPLVRQAAAVE